MGDGLADLGGVRTVAELGGVLRQLRRRQARQRGAAELSYRELAARTGWAHGAVGEYLAGRTLPPTDRFDVLVLLLGATDAERGALATARDRVAELRRASRQSQQQSQQQSRQPAPVPRELPPEVYGFVGRDDEHAELDALLAAPGSPVLAAIVGMAGVGKTALALSWAHRVRERFPEGQLYLDLRGYDPDRPVPAERALGALLRSLGVDGSGLPSDAEELARRYRSLLAGRRMLVVLDNACTAEQVRPLLPGSLGCFALVTSRDDLAGLVALHGARRLELRPLPAEQAVCLLGALVGPRVSAEPAAAATLVQRCARLPLALRLAAELVAARPDTALAGLVGELTERRLDALDAGDDARSAIRSVFSWSLRHLPPAVARCFQLLGVHPGDDLDVDSATALVGEYAAPLLDRLERAHLVQRGRDNRYRMHDLLRAYATELGARHPDAHAAATRLLDHYVSAAAAANEVLFALELGRTGLNAEPHRAGRDGRDGRDPGRDGRGDGERLGALAWLDTERGNLVAACGHAARNGWAARCGELASVLWRYLDAHAYYHDALAVHTEAAGVAAPGTPAEAEALTNLAMARWRLGQCERALPPLHRALTVRRETGDRAGEARVLGCLGIVCEQLSRYADSLEHYRAALAAYRSLGDVRRQAVTLGNLGVLYWRLGRYPEAIECQERAAAAGRELGDQRMEGYALANLGLVYQQVGRYTDALHSHRRALAESRRFGDRRAEADTLSSLGVTYARMERLPEAVEHLEQALAISRELTHRCLEAETLNNLGEAVLAMRRFDAALAHHTSGHAVAAEVGDRYEQARALSGMARALELTGHCAEAARRREAARTIYADLGLAEAAAFDPTALPRNA